MTTYIKLMKSFRDSKATPSHFVFYIKEEIASTDNHPYRFSYLHLLAMADVALKNGEIVKNRFTTNEELFDILMGVSRYERMG